ncbi:MAG TPA: hypothetical protein VNI77_03340 [Nitrososphaera sp.]|nr:hypothetical protein [Nitrososphaera sp.]
MARVQLTGRADFPLNLNNLLRMTVCTPSGVVHRIDEFKINNDRAFAQSFTPQTTKASKWTINARFDIWEAQVVIDVLAADLFDKLFTFKHTCGSSAGRQHYTWRGRCRPEPRH